MVFLVFNFITLFEFFAVITCQFFIFCCTVSVCYKYFVDIQVVCDFTLTFVFGLCTKI